MATVKVLVVAGGGGGNGSAWGAGGGAGGVKYNASFTVTTKSYNVTVGAGGSGTYYGTPTGTNGGNSVFDSITSTGGGLGGYVTTAGSAGGSSGGSGSRSGTKTASSPAGEGYAGGAGSNVGDNANESSGGGGGAGAVGADGTTSAGGNGGDGVSTYSDLLIAANAGVDISGTHWIGGGGGGSKRGGGTQGAGGKGGGGNAVNGTASQNGVSNTGGGGGGNVNVAGGNGGSGIVIISYVTGTFLTRITGASNTQTISGSDTICTFFESGTFTIVSIKKINGVLRASIKKVGGKQLTYSVGVDDSYTKSLLHMNGTDASTTFTDESGKTWTAVSNAQLDTAQKKFGTASGLFNGTTDYLTTPDSDDWNFGTGDFTIDSWVRFNALPTAGLTNMLWGQGASSTAVQRGYIYHRISPDRYELYYDSWSDGSTYSSFYQIVTLATNTWYHIAWIRNGTNWYVSLDGTLSSASSKSYTVPNLSDVFCIGFWTAVDSPLPHNGWIDEFRVSKGIARWTANFTPPTAEYYNNQVKKFMGVSNV